MITSPTNAVFRLVWLLVLMAVLLFVLAGTLFYWQAWLYLALFFTAALAVTLYMRHFDPALYERRMRGGPGAETQAAQKVIMTLDTLGFASLGGATLDNEENYLIKKLFTALGAIQIENQARI